MDAVTRCTVRHAHAMAREIGARAVLIYADALAAEEELQHLLRAVDFRTIMITRSQEGPTHFAGCQVCNWVTVPDVPMTRAGQVKMALLVSLAKGLLERGDSVVCLAGLDGSDVIDTLIILNLETEPELYRPIDSSIIGDDVQPEVFERALTLATQLAVEGREGRPIGTILIVGDAERVMDRAHNLVLNPFHGYPEGERNILDLRLEETIKEFAAIDGAFIIRGDGVVMTAGAQLLSTAKAVNLPKGLGTRHAAAAAITISTDAAAICVSESTGVVSVFKSGQMVADIHRPGNGSRLPV
jgi:diadenylate cyclase